MRVTVIITFIFLTLIISDNVIGNVTYKAEIEGLSVLFVSETTDYKVNIVPDGNYSKQWKVKVGTGNWTDLGQGETQSYTAPSDTTPFVIKCEINGHQDPQDLEVTTISATFTGPNETIEGEDSTAFTVSFLPEDLTIENINWSFELPTSVGIAGNTPAVDFASPNELSTIINKAHWYAYPNQRDFPGPSSMAVYLSCTYEICFSADING
jgi:hypothetical protein